MDGASLLDMFREEMSDQEADYLWSDDAFFSYLTDAQQMFCRLTQGIEDASTPSITQFAITPMVSSYPISPLILKIRTCNRIDTGRELHVRNAERLVQEGIRLSAQPSAGARANTTAYALGDTIGVTANDGKLHLYRCTLAGITDTAQGVLYPGVAFEVVMDGTAMFTDQNALMEQGPICGVVQGLTKGFVRTYPIPNETVVVQMSVFRLPLVDVTESTPALEIDAQHHMPLLFWVKHKAYDKQDAETFNRRKSDEFEARFRAYCATATAEQERARRTVGTVQYGGI